MRMRSNNLELVRKDCLSDTFSREQQASSNYDDQNAYSDCLAHYMLELENKKDYKC